MQQNQRYGFTLIELSIVLVIIGLIIGGILIGKDMIEVAQLNKLQKDVVMLQAAVNTFKAKYNCLPGDCPNATDFFPAGNCDGSIESATAVCNGDGDGVIGGDGTGAGIVWAHQWENFYFWRMLNAAGMIPFIIPKSGYTMPCTLWECLDSSSTAEGSWPNSIMYIANMWDVTQVSIMEWWPGSGGSPNFMPVDYTNALIYGNQTVNYGLGANNGGLSSMQAQSIDTKYDDGYANTGNIIAGNSQYISCAAATSSTPFLYTPITRPGSCSLIYLHFF